MRIIDILRLRPVYLKDGTKLTLISDHQNVGLYSLTENDKPRGMVPAMTIADDYFDKIDWGKTDNMAYGGDV